MEEQGTGTILEYARTQTRDFTEYPFQTADALVFALLSYDRIPQSVPRLKSLVARYGSLSRRVRSFDWRHPWLRRRRLCACRSTAPRCGRWSRS